ncbi:MAG: hypothetical protein AAF611_02575 [Bacteroidota bacterium]
MEKSDLVIDTKQNKVFLNDIAIGNVYEIDMVNGFILKIFFESVNLLSDVSLSRIFRKSSYEISIEVFNKHLSGSPVIYDLLFIFRKESNRLGLFIDHRYFEKPFTIYDFRETIKKRLKDNTYITMNSKSLLEVSESNRFEFKLKKLDNEKDIKSLFYLIIKELNEIMSPHIIKLNEEKQIDQDMLNNTFTFPPEIQSSCEQYLIYFATFLKDIGINAETNIESKAHETLFTVTPKDGEEALDKIKEALHIYLSLPESPEFESVAAELHDVGVHQLVSQVHFLKSQLAMGKTMIQMKDATIEALKLTNYQQKAIIQSNQKQEENEEKIADGLVTVTKVNVKGFSFDLPEFLRRIKRKFQ